MDEKQYNEIMSMLKDIKKRVMLLSLVVGFSLGLVLSVLVMRI